MRRRSTNCSHLTDLDNGAGVVDSVRWGAIDVPSDADLGKLDLDDFEWQ